MDKRTILAIVLIVIVYFVSNQLLWKKNAPVVQPPTETVTAVSDQVTQKTVPQPPVQVNETAPMEIETNSEINNSIKLSNSKMSVIFTNQGASIREVFLADYQLHEGGDIQLIPEDTTIGGISLLTEKGLSSIKETIFSHQFTDNNRTLIFYLEKDGSRIFERTYSINDDYSMNMHISMNGLASVKGYDIDYGAGIKDTERYLKNKRMEYKFIAQINNAVEAASLSKLKDGTIKEYSGKADWAAVRSKYFLLGLIPDKAVPSNQITAFKNNESPAFILKVRNPDFSNVIEDDYRLYFGPSILDELKKFETGMENVVERGWKWLKPLGTVFAYFLSWLHKYIPNYGIVLIILAILLKIVLNPLTHKSLESGQKMQKIQPELKSIQSKFKGDPKRLQEELQKVYKANKVSPLGGCLPLLLQMPIFIALYNVLRYSLDMRQAGFIGYLSDLSEPDKFYILPIIMAVMMFVQQKMMSPKPIQNEKGEIDEKQAAMVQSQRMMMYVMPIMMFWIFKSMPAGLVLYWTTMNVLSIIQQFYIKKKLQG